MKLILCLVSLTTIAMAAGAVVACNGTSVGALDKGEQEPDAAIRADADTEATAKTCTDGNVTSIAGTWHVIGSGSRSSASTLSIDANTFSFVEGKRSLQFSVAGSAMTLRWTVGAKTTPIDVSHGAASGGAGLGVIPLALEGSWVFASQSDSQNCSSSLGDGTFVAACEDVRGTPLGTLNGTITGQRTASLPSLFGSLGGTWHLTTSDATVDVTISGNTFAATGTGTRLLRGTTAFHVCGKTASGTTSDGLEFAATRE